MYPKVSFGEVHLTEGKSGELECRSQHNPQELVNEFFDGVLNPRRGDHFFCALRSRRREKNVYSTRGVEKFVFVYWLKARREYCLLNWRRAGFFVY